MRRGHPVGTSSRPCLVPGSIETQEGVFLHGLLCFPSRPRVTLMPSKESLRFMFFFLLKSGVFAVEIRIPSSLEALCTVVAVVLNRQLAVPVPNQPMQLLKCSARCHIQDKKPPDQPPNDSQSQYSLRGSASEKCICAAMASIQACNAGWLEIKQADVAEMVLVYDRDISLVLRRTGKSST
ncbi:hypothetical protein FJTKL_10243 [Diaporthe vaccinii]|uniref:Uncharacterized protein n=1 Tax=Diaporthe vaccinii TaxID=105482 RepID=A0ABR4EKC4_9PEZI